MTPEVIAREKAGSKLQIIPFKRGKKASNSTRDQDFCSSS